LIHGGERILRRLGGWLFAFGQLANQPKCCFDLGALNR